MSRVAERLRTSVAALVIVACAAAPAHGASVVDPLLRFRVLTTPHFSIYFHQQEEQTARRLAAIAEDTWRTLHQPLRNALTARTHVVLVDQTELANGSASPIPFDTIVVTATWPSGSESIGLTDDWLRLVFTHEYTHILHLDRSAGWSRVVRTVFGRAPLAFPNLFLPIWQVEGLAVYEESQLGDQGRLHAGDFRAIVDAARRDRTFEPLDRVNGGLIDWPDGTAPYAYGAPFHEFLAERYGAASLAALADRTAREIPYTTSLAFKHVYGKSLGDLWRDFRSLPPAEMLSDAGDPPRQLTHHGFDVQAPRFAPAACSSCRDEIVYTLRTPHGFPSLNAIALDGSGDHVVTKRYLGTTTGVSRELLVFDQDEVRRGVGLYSDLYVLRRGDKRVRALTMDARLRDPDLSPDATRVVCVQDGHGQRDLVVFSLSEPSRLTVLASEPETQFDAPRWSPDGASIAVARHRLDAESEIVVVDASTGNLRVVASTPNTRIITPAWKPDGRAIIAAADANGGVFNLYEFDPAAVRPPRMLTQTANGAMWPDISKDGKTLVFVGYTSNGYDLFTMPYPEYRPENLPTLFPSRSPENLPTLFRGGAARFEGTARRYTPWSTLAPTSWAPFFDSSSDQLRFGAATSGADVLGYHAYALSATWLVSAPHGARTSDRATPDWTIAYAYTRWQPVLFATASRTTSFFAGPPTDAGEPTDADAREYQIEAGVQWPFIHARVSHVAFASILRSADAYQFATETDRVRRTELRLGWQSNTSHTYGYSISAEDGVSLAATADAVPKSFGSSPGATTLTVDSRAYLPGFAAHHVVAVRAGAGSTAGSPLAGRTFLLGGPGPAPAPLGFSSRAFALLRGFPADTFAGTHVAVVNIDYRLPLAYLERGHGTFPLFLRTLHASVFGDAANAWTHEFRARGTKTSAGAELSADIVAGYSLPVTVTAGVAWGHDGARVVGDGATVYARIGRAF
jgi:hypothetical protein